MQWPALGAVATLALVVAVVTHLNPELDSAATIDAYYASVDNEFSRTWASQALQPHRAALATRAFFSKPKTSAETVIEQGFAQGAMQLGKDKFAALSIHIEKLNTTATPPETETEHALYQLGRYAAVATLHCALDKQAPTLADAPAMLDATFKNLAQLNDEAVGRLRAAWSAKQETGVCGLAEAVTMNVFR